MAPTLILFPADAQGYSWLCAQGWWCSGDPYVVPGVELGVLRARQVPSLPSFASDAFRNYFLASSVVPGMLLVGWAKSYTQACP